jgi:hypothetical protein
LAALGVTYQQSLDAGTQSIKNLKVGNTDMDWCLYKYRHLVENLFARIKHFRAIATRFDKLKRNNASVVAMACAFLWLPM